MFSGLRQNSILYILEKTNDGLVLKTGTIESVSNPSPKMNQYGVPITNNYGQQQELYVDVKVKVDDDMVEFKQLGANLSIANSGNVVVSDNREMMDAEVDGQMNISKRHIEATPYHEKILASGEPIKRKLNPQFAKDKEQEEKIGLLEERMGGIEGTLGSIQDMLAEALNRSSISNVSKKKE